MDSWLKTGRLASGKSVPAACSLAESNDNILVEDVPGLSVRMLYLPSIIKA